MADTSARRKKQRPEIGDHCVDTMTRHALRSETGLAQPSDAVRVRLMARVAATPRPGRTPIPPPSRWVRWWLSFVATAPRLSARLTPMGAAALLLIMLVHGSLSALNPEGAPLPTASGARAALTGFDVVARMDRPTAISPVADPVPYDEPGVYPTRNHPPGSQDLIPPRVILPPDPPAEAVDETENPNNISPQRALGTHNNPIVAPLPGEPDYRFVGQSIR